MNVKMNEDKKQYWFVIKQLTGKEIKRKYSRSKLGVLWSVLNPLLHMVVMSAIFTAIFRRSIENFPVYYLIGNILYSFFTEATKSSMTSLADNSTLLIKLKLPMKIFPASKTVSALVNLGLSLIPFVAVLVFFRIKINFCALFFIPIVILLYLFSIGIGNMLSIAYVFFGDIKYLYGVFTTLLMYCSAIFYPVSSLGPEMANVVNINPVYSFIYSARECIMYGRMPDLKRILYMLICTLAIYFIGNLVFEKNKNKVIQKV